MDDRLLTLDEVAEYLNVSRRTVYRLLKGGGIPAFRIGNHLRFKRSNLEAWLESQREPTAEDYVGRSPDGKESGFTLLELLIVVAIVGILAAVAVPSFLDAQVWAKVARAQADMASIAQALEVYAAGHNDYPPNDGRYNVTPIQLTTPVQYMTGARPVDPFALELEHPQYGKEAMHYTYTRVVDSPFAAVAPPVEGVDHPLFNPGAGRKYGKWFQLSVGPDQMYSGKEKSLGRWPTYLFDTPYDPSNGTVSFGNILRTHRETEVTKRLTVQENRD